MGAVSTMCSNETSKPTERAANQSADVDNFRQDKHQPLILKDASSNTHDAAAASFVFEQCQLLGVPLTAVNDGVRLRC